MCPVMRARLPACPGHTAWMPHSCCWNDMVGTSTPYAVGGEAAEIWINGHGNALGAQGHQGESTMREKGEVWGLRVI